VHLALYYDLPQFVKINLPVITSGLGLRSIRMKGNIDTLASVEDNRWQVLVEERFKHNNLIARLQESSEHGVLA
jgi:hypothetical protein